jgi:flagellar biosynthesis protein FlhB
MLVSGCLPTLLNMCYPEVFIGIWNENKKNKKIKSKFDRVDQKRLTKNIFGATTFVKFNQSFLSSKISCAQMFCFTIHASVLYLELN